MDGCHCMILAMSYRLHSPVLPKPTLPCSAQLSAALPFPAHHLSSLLSYVTLTCSVLSYLPTILLLLQERKRQAKESEKDAKESDSKNRVALDAASKVMLLNLISII